MALQWKPARERRNWLLHLPKHSTIWIRYALHQKDHHQQAILCRFQKKFFQRSENWNSPSLFRCFAPCLAFLRAEKLSWSVVLRPKNAQTFIGRNFFLHTPDFLLSKVTALKVVWGKDTSRRSKMPGSDLPSYFSAWAPFCKCGWRHHLVVTRTAGDYICSNNSPRVFFVGGRDVSRSPSTAGSSADRSTHLWLRYQG